jgi:hypothetical protein
MSIRSRSRVPRSSQDGNGLWDSTLDVEQEDFELPLRLLSSHIMGSLAA